MDYEMFKEIVAEGIKDLLPPVYEAFNISFHRVPKINGTKEAMVLDLCGEDFRIMSPNIYLDDFYDETGDTESLAVRMKEMAALILNCTGTQRLESDTAELEQYRDRIVRVLINREKNRELLEMVPYREFLDLAEVYRIAVKKEDGSGYATAVITRDLFEELDMDENELAEFAAGNTPEILEIEKIRLSEEMYVITSTDAIFGAYVLACPEILAEVAELMNDDLYILPTSVHEIMAVRAGVNSAVMLKELLRDGNESLIEADEFLSENIYYYERSSGRVSIAETEKK